MDTVAEDLAADYAAAVRGLDRHWPDGRGGCSCGAMVSPCDAEVVAARAVTAAEVAWRDESTRRVR